MVRTAKKRSSDTRSQHVIYADCTSEAIYIWGVADNLPEMSLVFVAFCIP